MHTVPLPATLGRSAAGLLPLGFYRHPPTISRTLTLPTMPPACLSSWLSAFGSFRRTRCHNIAARTRYVLPAHCCYLVWKFCHCCVLHCWNISILFPCLRRHLCAYSILLPLLFLLHTWIYVVCCMVLYFVSSAFCLPYILIWEVHLC